MRKTGFTERGYQDGLFLGPSFVGGLAHPQAKYSKAQRSQIPSFTDPGGSVVKNPPAKQEMKVWSLGQEDPLEKEMATHSRILAW